MSDKNKNISFEEILDLLRSVETRENAIKFLKSIEPSNENVKGLKVFLEQNEWDYSKVEAFEESSDAQFESLLSEQTSKSKSWFRVAAVIIPLIGIGALVGYFISDGTSESKELYAKYYQKEIGMPTLMSNTTEKVFNESMAAFKDEAYTEALRGFEKILEEQSQNDTLLYFSACSNMELSNNEKAIRQFRKIDSESIFHEKSEYRLALTYIKSNQFENAKKLLQKMAADSKHQYSEKAEKILRESAFE